MPGRRVQWVKLHPLPSASQLSMGASGCEVTGAQVRKCSFILFLESTNTALVHPLLQESPLYPYCTVNCLLIFVRALRGARREKAIGLLWSPQQPVADLSIWNSPQMCCVSVTNVCLIQRSNPCMSLHPQYIRSVLVVFVLKPRSHLAGFSYEYLRNPILRTSVEKQPVFGRLICSLRKNTNF